MLGLSRDYAISIVSMVAMGFGFGCSGLLCDTIFMVIVPKNILGRFYGNIGIFTMGIMPLIMWLAGYTADKFSAAAIFTITGAFLLTFCLIWLLQYKKTSVSILEQEKMIA